MTLRKEAEEIEFLEWLVPVINRTAGGARAKLEDGELVVRNGAKTYTLVLADDVEDDDENDQCAQCQCDLGDDDGFEADNGDVMCETCYDNLEEADESDDSEESEAPAEEATDGE